MEIIGYFVDINGDMENPADVFVAIEKYNNGKFAYYCSVGQHGEGSTAYLDECESITKEEYLKATEGFYTPADYLK